MLNTCNQPCSWLVREKIEERGAEERSVGTCKRVIRLLTVARRITSLSLLFHRYRGYSLTAGSAKCWQRKGNLPVSALPLRN